MKTSFLRIKPDLAVAVVMSFSAAFASAQSTIQLPTIPSSFDIVYKLKGYTAPTASQLGVLIGLSGIPEVLKRTPKKFGTVQYYVDPEKPTNFFELDQTTGALSFSHDLSKYEGDFAPTLPQTDDEAKRIAEGYLNDNKLMPTLAAGDAIVLAGVQTVTAGRPQVAGKGPGIGANGGATFDKLKIVTYRRTIYGLPVIGPGSKIIVTIGDKNTVEGAIIRWRSFIPPTNPPVRTTNAAPKAPVKGPVRATVPTPVITPSAALSALQDRLKRKFPEIDDQSLNAMILSMNVGLYDSNVGNIQPIYVFKLDLHRKSTTPVPGTDAQELFLTASPYLKTPPEAIYQLGDLPNNAAPKATDAD